MECKPPYRDIEARAMALQDAMRCVPLRDNLSCDERGFGNRSIGHLCVASGEIH